MQLLLQLWTVLFETLQVYFSWFEDMHVLFLYSWIYYIPGIQSMPKRYLVSVGSVNLFVCPGKHPRFGDYFGHNYEVFWGLFHLKYISLAPKSLKNSPKFNIEVSPKPKMLELPLFLLSVSVWFGLLTPAITKFYFEVFLLAHLSRRLMVSYCDHSPSVVGVVVVVVVVRMSVCPQSLNNISS